MTAPIIVEFTVRLGYAIFAIATLSFLGFGIQPPSPDWGLQISENVRADLGRLLVADPLPRARDRHARRRRQPDFRRHHEGVSR